MRRVPSHNTARKLDFLHVNNRRAIPGRKLGGITSHRRFVASWGSHARLVDREAAKVLFVKKLVVVLGAHSDQSYRFEAV